MARLPHLLRAMRAALGLRALPRGLRALALALPALLLAAWLAACQTTMPPASPDMPADGRDVSATRLTPPVRAGAGPAGPVGAGGAPTAGPPVIEMGTGRFVGPPGGGGQIPPTISTTGPDVTLDFVGVDVRDVARSVLGGILHVTYVIDPAVQGAVTLQTGQPVPRSRVLPLLTDALQVSGVALTQRDGVFTLVPIAAAARNAAMGGGSGGTGFVTRVVTPQYVAASELQRVLQPLLPPGASMQADPSRNVLVVTGTEQAVGDVLRNVSTFDVDYLRGMSFALLPLRNAQARDVAAEVTTLLGSGKGAIGNVVSVAPLERLNAVLVTAMQPAYLDRVRAWVERLDRAGPGTQRQLYVYRVQNGRAANLAAVLRRAMGIDNSSGDTGAGPQNDLGQTTGQGAAGGLNGGLGGGGLGGGLGGGGLGGGGLGGGGLGGGLSGAGGSNALGRAPSVLLGALAAQSRGVTQTGGVAGPQGGAASGLTTSGDTGGGGDQNAMRITADEVNNALVIAATPDEYETIRKALQKLDVTPLQVVIDATIAEVTLTNQLQYGLQYYIQSGDFRALLSNPNASSSTSGNNGTAGSGTTGGSSGLASVFSGFNYIPGLNIATTGANGAVILSALSSLTRVQVLSSPNLLVLNNQSARIQVGDQVPIATQSAVSTLTVNAPQVNTIEYRDTGVILSITPRVNASGLVLLDIAEEVSNPSTTTTSSIASPTISQRRVTSSVAVSDGETVALGGLIQDNTTKGKNGVPYLQDIPVLGFLFGTHSDALTRTELIVLITPHVVRSDVDARAITDELRRKLPLTIPVVAPRGG
ncbi:MAG: type II secretion system secretin GspD [Proteobacteria bacterium]|nr:type II secretion system secretin GspD [Pseudomonadota bacterium]